MSKTPTYDICIKRGETFGERTIEIFENIGGVETALRLDNCEIAMQVRQNPGTEVLEEWSTANGDIIFDTPEKAVLKEKEITTDPGTYQHDLKIKFPDDFVLVYWEGVFKVSSTITELP